MRGRAYNGVAPLFQTTPVCKGGLQPDAFRPGESRIISFSIVKRAVVGRKTRRTLDYVCSIGVIRAGFELRPGLSIPEPGGLGSLDRAAAFFAHLSPLN